MKHHFHTTIIAAAVMLTAFIASAQASSKFIEKKNIDGFWYSMFVDLETNERYAEATDVDINNIPSGHVIMKSSVTDAEGNAYPCTVMGNPYGGMFSQSVGTPCPDITKLTIPSSYKTVRASELSGLTEVELAEGIELIEFSGCQKLANINLPSSLTTVYLGSTALTSIVLPENITFFNVAACTELVSIKLPSTITELKDYAFMGCEKLETIDLPESITTLGYSLFANSGLKKITLPPHIKVLKGAFNEANKLEEVVLNDELEKLDGSFDYCESLKKVTFGKSLKYIGDASFRNTGLTEVDIPDHVEHIGYVAFAFCDNLKRVHLGKGITSLRAYSEAWTPEKAVEGCIFYGSPIIEEVTFDGEIEDFGECTFESNDKLRAMPQCQTVKKIGRQCFRNTFLKKLIIPASVEEIGEMAFALSPFIEGQDDDYSLVRCEAVVPPTLGENAFQTRTLEKRTLYVPKGSLAAYQQAEGWKEFKSIKEYDPSSISAPSHVNGMTKVYDLQGRQLTSPRKGVNIINTRKVVIQ